MSPSNAIMLVLWEAAPDWLRGPADCDGFEQRYGDENAKQVQLRIPAASLLTSPLGILAEHDYCIKYIDKRGALEVYCGANKLAEIPVSDSEFDVKVWLILEQHWNDLDVV